MKKNTIYLIVTLIAAGIMSGAASLYGWHSHEEYIEKIEGLL